MSNDPQNQHGSMRFRAVPLFLLMALSAVLGGTGVYGVNSYKQGQQKILSMEDWQKAEQTLEEAQNDASYKGQYLAKCLQVIRDHGLTAPEPPAKPEKPTAESVATVEADKATAPELVEKAKLLLYPVRDGKKGKPTKEDAEKAKQLLDLAVAKDDKLSSAWAERAEAKKFLKDKSWRKDADKALELTQAAFGKAAPAKKK